MTGFDVRAEVPHFVYELLNAEGEHLYVGCTSNLPQRLGNHASTKDWAAEIVRVEASRFPDMRTALDIERELIEQYQPRHNVVYTDRYDTGGWATRRRLMAEKHALGQFCHDRTCKPCIQRAHDLNVTCDAVTPCSFCKDFAPWYSLMSAEERRRHPDWEPLWEQFLDRVPTYDEVSAFFAEHYGDFRSVVSRGKRAS